MLNRILSISCAVAVLSLAGCVTVETQSFRVNPNSNIESSQIAVGADFSKYDRIMSGGFGIYFAPASAPSDEDLQRLRSTFVDAFRQRLEGFKVVQEKGATTLQVDASLVDLRNTGGAPLPNFDRNLDDIARSGNLIFLMEIKDSMTGEVLARAADSAKTPSLAVGANSETNWDSVQESAEYWATLFRRFLDENLDHSG